MTGVAEEGQDVELDHKVGIFKDGVWGNAQGMPLSKVIPGEACTLTVAWKLRRKGAQPPSEVAFHVFPEVAKRSALPEPLFELTGAVIEGAEEGLARLEWTPPKDPAQWPEKLPARLMFMPVLDNWRLRKGKRPWKQPMVDLEDAWEVKSWWDPAWEYVGGQAKLRTLVYGLDPAQATKVTFTLFYVVGVCEAPLEGVDGVEGSVEAELTSEGVENKGELTACAAWQIPNPDVLRKAAEQAGLDPDEEDEDDGVDAPQEVSAGTALLPRIHTIRFKMETGDADDQLQGFSDLDVREPRFFFSL